MITLFLHLNSCTRINNVLNVCGYCRKQNIAMCDNLYERYDKAVVILVVNTTELRHWD